MSKDEQYPTYGEIDKADSIRAYQWLHDLPLPKVKQEWIKLKFIGERYFELMEV
jgi:hypothetical protein